MQKYLNERQVSDLTGIPVQTLRNHRCRGVGFPFVKLTRHVRYPEKDLLEFLESRKIETSDSLETRPNS